MADWDGKYISPYAEHGKKAVEKPSFIKSAERLWKVGEEFAEPLIQCAEQSIQFSDDHYVLSR